jgi:Fic family protein
MEIFSSELRAGVAAIEAASLQPVAKLTKAQRLAHTVVLACRVFVRFLTIHPYANGNGHIARFLLIAILLRQGFRLKDFMIEPRPADPPYSGLIKRYRSGDGEPFERYIVGQLV